MSSSQIPKHYARLLSSWPNDPLRPTVTFHALLRARASRFPNPPSNPSSTTTPSASSSAAAAPQSSSSSSGATGNGTGVTDPRRELPHINALYGLLEDRYRNAFPTTPRLLRPASQPTYYEDLVREMAEAPTRGWWARALTRWRGMFRLR